MAKSAQAVKVSESTEAADAHEAPLVKTANVRVNECGQMWRSVLVRMPEGAVADDLRDPKIWRAVQGAGQAVALIKLDQLLILGYDESWGAEAMVVHATHAEARLLIKKVFGFGGGVGEGLYTDGNLQVAWDGASYCVRRVADQVIVDRGFSSEGQAIDALRRHYPKRVG
jgi:hypothetical protein